MQSTNLSLRGLEIFQLIAKHGSVRRVSNETGLSVSTVSHHLRNVEECVGVDLLDHSRRPMVLTPSGSIFARYVDEGLSAIRRGETELASGDLAQMRELRFGTVDDFDSEVAPELARFLARAMPRCSFKHHTRPSHEILDLLHEKRLDAAIATHPVADVTGLNVSPLLRDPLVLALPSNSSTSPEEYLSGSTQLPFLRYAQTQTIGKLIELHLRRNRVSLPDRFAFESNQSIFGMIADNAGWAVTTPASFNRAKRFHDQVTLHPLPTKGPARMISLFSVELFPQKTAGLIADPIRRLLQRYLVDPVSQSYPWLRGEFRVLDASDVLS